MSVTKPPSASTVLLPAEPMSPTTLSIGDAARLLGVSIKTVRRWEADGRILAVRTEGGHRRFPIDDLMALHARSQDRSSSASQLRTATLPSRPLPALDRLLRTRLDPILMRTTRHIYGEFRPGWFRSAAAAPHIKTFADQVATAAKSGDWEIVLPATAVLIVRAGRADGGPTYQETFMFLRVLRAVLTQELRLHDESAPKELTKLFEAVEQEAATNAGHFFSPASEVNVELPATEEGLPRFPVRATAAAQSACQMLAAMPSSCGALVLAGPQGGDRLEVISVSGLELNDVRLFKISEDPLSAALAGTSATFVRSTVAARRLPLASPPERCLPVVASTEPAANLRVATVVLVRSGADVESGVLAPLADLNGRLGSMLANLSAESDVSADLARIGPFLGSPSEH